MSVFGGWWQYGVSLDEDILSKMADAQLNNGDEGSEQGFYHNEQLHLFHRQTYFTPEDYLERQPLIEGNLVIAFDGRLDNRPAIANALGINQSLLDTLPDSQLVLRAYQTWQEHCVEHFIGSFSFVVYDNHQQRIYAATDFLNSRPLYYYKGKGFLAFACNPSSLFKLPGVRRTLNRSSLIEHLLIRPIEHDQTFFQDIQRVPSGHYMLVDQSSCQHYCYWSEKNIVPVRFSNPQDYYEAFDELFSGVVKSLLRTNEEVGVSLSGGLDSSTVAWHAAKHLKLSDKSLYGYTSVPAKNADGFEMSGRYNDESPRVKSLAKRISNLQTHWVAPSVNKCIWRHGLEDYFEGSAAPSLSPCNREWMQAIYQAANKHKVKVMLNGAVGNSTISWSSPTLLPYILKDRKYKEFLGAIKHLGANGSVLKALVSQFILPHMPYELMRWQLNLLGRGKGKNKLLNPSIKRNFSDNPRVQNRNNTVRQRLFTMQSRTTFFEAAMRQLYNIETRDPTADQRVLEFCLGIPETIHSSVRQQRKLVRQTMAARLPEDILGPGRGQQSANWLYMMQYSREELLEDAKGFVDTQLLREVLDLPKLCELLDNMSEVIANESAVNIRKLYRRGVAGAHHLGAFVAWNERLSKAQ